MHVEDEKWTRLNSHVLEVTSTPSYQLPEMKYGAVHILLFVKSASL